jgi:7-cyano-7-deazaguanine synthase
MGINPPKRRATVLLSGGLDSAACAHFLQGQGLSVSAVFVNYGQAAAVLEWRAAVAMAERLDLPLRTLSVTGGDQFGSGELAGRNAFLVFAALFLGRATPGLLAAGIHAGTPYYDCSEDFVELIGRLVADSTDGRVSFLAPFVSWTKQDVYNYFVAASLPTKLTYSCEAGTDPPCGVCLSCGDRKALGC